jgi:rubrerythrin
MEVIVRKYKCSICGYIHVESIVLKWEDLGDDYLCPECGAPKFLFNLIERNNIIDQNKIIDQNDKPIPQTTETAGNTHNGLLKELSAEEISAICSSLAKGCEKQRLNSEMEAFYKIADYFKARSVYGNGKTLNDAALMLNDDISNGYPAANNAAKTNSDRGALRSLVWSEKVSVMMKSLLDLFAKKGDDMLAHAKLHVCDICGFIYLGNSIPHICPVCKVPAHKIIQVERR